MLGRRVTQVLPVALDISNDENRGLSPVYEIKSEV